MIDRHKAMIKEEEFAKDMFFPPRAPYETSQVNPWWYLRGTDSSIDEFEEFLKTNYSSAPFELKKSDTVDRSTLRKMLYEYLLTKINYSRHSKFDMENDKLKYFLAGKGVKDYLIYTNLKEFKYEHIAHFLESKAIICFMNMMVNDMASEIEAFELTNFCERTGCTEDLVEKDNFRRWKFESTQW